MCATNAADSAAPTVRSTSRHAKVARRAAPAPRRDRARILVTSRLHRATVSAAVALTGRMAQPSPRCGMRLAAAAMLHASCWSAEPYRVRHVRGDVSPLPGVRSPAQPSVHQRASHRRAGGSADPRVPTASGERPRARLAGALAHHVAMGTPGPGRRDSVDVRSSRAARRLRRLQPARAFGELPRWTRGRREQPRVGRCTRRAAGATT
jgi:hypothetical protein